jgi:hypothetical protein
MVKGLGMSKKQTQEEITSFFGCSQSSRSSSNLLTLGPSLVKN